VEGWRKNGRLEGGGQNFRKFLGELKKLSKLGIFPKKSKNYGHNQIRRGSDLKAPKVGKK